MATRARRTPAAPAPEGPGVDEIRNDLVTLDAALRSVLPTLERLVGYADRLATLGRDVAAAGVELDALQQDVAQRSAQLDELIEQVKRRDSEAAVRHREQLRRFEAEAAESHRRLETALQQARGEFAAEEAKLGAFRHAAAAQRSVLEAEIAALRQTLDTLEKKRAEALKFLQGGA